MRIAAFGCDVTHRPRNISVLIEPKRHCPRLMAGNCVAHQGLTRRRLRKRNAGSPAQFFGERMESGDLYVQAVEAIYACGSGEGLVADALSATSRLLGATGATYEVIDKSAGGLLWCSSAGVPSAASERYSDHFATVNPRIPAVLGQRTGEL